jgi:branched-chain amino acid transport system ATP-binding protein
MLEIDALHTGYGDAPALWDVSLRIGAGELVSVVGPNGAGKTTLVNTIACLLPVWQGTMRWEGRDISRTGAHALCRQGIAIIPEGRRLFGGMSVEENLDMGCYEKAARAKRTDNLARVFAMFPILKERRRQMAGTLSGGQQQMLAISRALMACPRLLLIDEPSLGLAPAIVTQVFEAIRAIHAEGVSILLIEQNVAKALEVAERAYVLEGGRIVGEGKPAELLGQPRIREAYLGEVDDRHPRESGGPG